MKQVPIWLPGTVIGTGAWATVTFNPHAVVSMYGKSLEDELNIYKKAKSLKGYIGIWTDDGFQGDIAHGIRKDEALGYVIEYISVDDPQPDENPEQLERSIRNGKVTYHLKESPNNVYYQVEKNGNLSEYSDQGYLSTFKKVN